MMHPILTVFRKEVLENVRDRRVILSAFFFGVLMAPVLFGVMTTMLSNRAVRDQEQPLELPVAGVARAPNLMAFLSENGVAVQAVEYDTDQAIAAIRSNRHEFVLIVPANYGDRLQAGEPAPLDLIVDTSNGQASGSTARARRLLGAYGRQLASMRLLVRGISPQVIEPVDVRTVDISTPTGRSLLVLSMMTYFCLTSMLVGGFYLAIDTTAGERERGSLESLLALPVGRGSLILGKIMATAAFMAVSLLLTLSAFSVALSFVPLERLGMSANFGPPVVLAIFGVMATFLPLGAGLLTVVASFTRSSREAQTWLSVVLLIPIAPIMFAVVNGTRGTPPLMAVPSLSQHLLATQLLRGDPIDPLHMAISAVTSLGLGAVLVACAVALYRRDTILG